MGVDAGLYAKKAKRYYWFDRLKNIMGWNACGCKLYNDQELDRLNDIYVKATFCHKDNIIPEGISAIEHGGE